MLPLATLCAAVPPLCRLVREADVRAALTAAPPDLSALARAAAAHPGDANPLLSALTELDAPTLAMLPAGADLALWQNALDDELVALMHLCRQCRPGEMLRVLHRCTAAPTPEGLAILLNEQRREQTRAVYGLQLLWRSLQDERIPDALSLFADPVPESPADVREALLDRVRKEAAHA